MMTFGVDRRLVQETGHFLDIGAASIVNAFNPCRLILGGGVIDGLPELVAIVDRTVRERALRAATERLQVVCAALGNYAPVVGAAALARAADASSHTRTWRERVTRARRHVNAPPPFPSPPDARP